MDTPIYAPRDTEDWLKCPAYRDYNRRWTPRDHNWHPGAALGTAIAKGLEQFYKLLKRGVPATFEDAAATMANSLQRDWVLQDKWTLEGLLPIAGRGLQAGLGLEVGIGPGIQIIGIEEDLHRCRPDLVFRTPKGLVVHDWKVRFDLEKKWEDAAQREYQNSWQLRHNAWAIEQTFGEPVVVVQIGLIALTPKTRATLYPIPLTPRAKQVWVETAQVVWAERARQDAAGVPPPMNPRSCWTFPSKDRRCPFFDACWNLDRDEALFSNLYEEVHRAK